MHVSHLYCSATNKIYPPGRLHSLSEAGKPLMVAYHLTLAGSLMTREKLATRPANMWRYEEVLPLAHKENRITLDEGWTPLLSTPRLAENIDVDIDLYVKDESTNPTGSFKARGMAMAVSMAKELGVTRLAVPSAGNAAGALSAYAARGGLEAHIFMPADTPTANIVECREMGAEVTLVDGLITDCGKMVADKKGEMGWFDLSTLKEPYRIEGKKTMGYELFEQFGGGLPDVILYPTGGGTGLIGMWKAFDEMEKMGWIGEDRPRMITVQAAGCAPIVEAFRQGAESGLTPDDPHTMASGLRVPRAIGDFIVLGILRKSGGDAIAVTDEEIYQGIRDMGTAEGLFTCPEGGACWMALKKLAEKGTVKSGEKVVLFNTGSGFKYLDIFSREG